MKNDEQQKRKRSERLVKLMNIFLALNFFLEYKNYKQCVYSKLKPKEVKALADKINKTRGNKPITEEHIDEVYEKAAVQSMNSMKYYQELMKKIERHPGLSVDTINKLVKLVAENNLHYMPQMDIYALDYFYYCVYLYQYVHKIIGKAALKKVLTEQSKMPYNMCLFRNTCLYMEKLYDEVEKVNARK